MEFKTLNNLKRVRDIVGVLVKHGFEDIVQRIELPGFQAVEKYLVHNDTTSVYERIRMVIEDLGPTFVKLGQIMSLRPDLLPMELVETLSDLQDDVHPLDFEDVRHVVESAYERPLKEVFSTFDPAPIASASIAQVHQAVLAEGGDIVSVKVRRPGLRRTMETDLDILMAIAVRLHERVENLQIYDLPNLIRATRRYLAREMDLLREVRNMQIARSLQTDADHIRIPKTFDEYCHEDILVMEFVHGPSLKHYQAVSQEERKSVARLGLRAAIKQILVDGFFHADPHPANILVADDGRLFLIDWGMVGRLTENDRFNLFEILRSVIDKDGNGLKQALLQLGKATDDVDEIGLERQLIDIIDNYHSIPIREMNIGRLLMEIIGLMRDYRIRLHPDLVIMIKALVTAEGTARRIYPDLNIIAESEQYITRVGRERYHPSRLWRLFRSSLSFLYAKQQEIPQRLVRVIEKVDDGRLTIRFRHDNLSGFQKTLESVFDRLTFGIIVAAMIIGSSMIITTGVGPYIFGFPALGVIGYVISAVVGLWILVNIVRKKKY